MVTFEEPLKKLETIVAQLERGDLQLEESMKLFEEGMRLSAECKKQLDEARGQGFRMEMPGDDRCQYDDGDCRRNS